MLLVMYNTSLIGVCTTDARDYAMKRPTTVINNAGEQWVVEYRESTWLQGVEAILITYGASSCIILSLHLSPAIRRRSNHQLLERLTMLPLGTPAIYLWSDEYSRRS
jgi:hypothetical protein